MISIKAHEPKNLAAVAVSAEGTRLLRCLATRLPGLRAHVPRRFLAPPETAGNGAEVVGYDEPASALVRRLFAEVDGLILVMAAGAAVRLVAPWLRDKYRDPAVAVVDDRGRFVISLLSGHLGGANQLTKQVAAVLGATAVITTASEGAGLPALDLLGAGLSWRIEPDSDLKHVAAALLNGERVAVLQECGQREPLAALPANAVLCDSPAELVAMAPAAAIIVTDRLLEPAALPGHHVLYRPPSLVLGVGCSSGAPAEEITALVAGTLGTARLSPLSVGIVATIDRKAAEPGLLAAVAALNCRLVTFSADALNRVEGDWSRSEVVQRAVGAGGVAEPAALLASGAPRLVVSKVKSAHATLAVARQEL